MCIYKNAQVHKPMKSFGLWHMKFTSFLMGNIQNTECNLRNTSFLGNLSVWCRLQWDCLERRDDQTGGRKGIEAGVIMSTVWTHPNHVSVTHINTSSMSWRKFAQFVEYSVTSVRLWIFRFWFWCLTVIISVFLWYTLFSQKWLVKSQIRSYVLLNW